MLKKQGSVLGLLVLLTGLFIVTEIIFFGIFHYTTNFDGVASSALGSQLIFSKIVLRALSQFLISQVVIYFIYIYFLWYLTVSVAELFSLTQQQARLLGMGLWLLSIISILFANAYYVSHSLFSNLLRHVLLKDILTNAQIKTIFLSAVALLIFATLLSALKLCFDLAKKQALARQCLFIALFSFIFIGLKISSWENKAGILSSATKDRPNVFIIGFDALRPDYLGYFNPKIKTTPHFDQFLKSSIVFTEAYTPLARTFPSWGSILTAKHPSHNHIREDSIDLETAHLNESLAAALKAQGYETIYASDDRRFSNINQKFGFDRIYGPDGTVADFLIGTLNDFPLSNLLTPTAAGKILFPYNYANHGAFITYEADNFLSLLNKALSRHSTKPLFLAVHLNQSAWPFYWFNDQQIYDAGSADSYQNAVLAADKLLAKFMTLLEKNGLLQHAIFVIVSDHGITLGLPHDRIVTEALYQGHKKNVRLARTKYSRPGKATLDTDQNIAFLSNPKNYGIDTSYGYGSDVLSLKQYRPILAFRGFGLSLGLAHSVSGPSSLIDIAPTILAFLQLPAFKHADGISLLPYFHNPKLSLSKERPIFLESGYSIPELEQDRVLIAQVVKKSIGLFQVDVDTGLVSMNPSTDKLFLGRRQRALILEDWLLAYYPSSVKYLALYSKTAVTGKVDVALRYKSYIAPGYEVLVNLKTGKWTTDLQSSFAATAPLKTLVLQLRAFYGKEMDAYLRK